MRTSIYHFFPLALPLLLVFLFVLGLVIALVEIGVLLMKNRMFGRALAAIAIVAIASIPSRTRSEAWGLRCRGSFLL